LVLDFIFNKKEEEEEEEEEEIKKEPFCLLITICNEL
jgi:hypothetical protein